MAGIQEGSVVKLSGLVGAPRLNGLEGTVQHFDRASGRWQVDLPGEGTKAIKPENLKPVKQEKETEERNVKDLLPGGLIGLLFGEPSSKAESDPVEDAEQADDIADDVGEFGDEEHAAEIHAEEEAAHMDEEEVVAEGEEGQEEEEQQEVEEQQADMEDPEHGAEDHDLEEGHEGEGEEQEGGEEAEAAPADEWEAENDAPMDEWEADAEQGEHDQEYPDGDGFDEERAEGKEEDVAAAGGGGDEEEDQSWGNWYGDSDAANTKGKEDGKDEKSNIYSNAAKEKEKAAAQKAAEGSDDSDDEWGDWKGNGPPASATGGIDATELSSLPVKDLKQKFAEFNLRIPVGITEKAELCENLVQQMTERKQEEERQERIRERKETAYAKFGPDSSGKDGKGKGSNFKGKGPCKGKGKVGSHGPANNHARPTPADRPPGTWQGGMAPPHPQLSARAKPGPKAVRGPTPPRGPPPEHLLRGAATTRPGAAPRMAGPIPQRPMPNVRAAGRPPAPQQQATFPPRVAPRPKPSGPGAGFGRPAGPVLPGPPPAYPPPRPGPPPPGPPPPPAGAATASQPPPPKASAVPRNAQEASKLAMERMQRQGLPAPGLLERIAMFVQRHRLADEVDVGMRLLPGKALLGLLDDPALARVLQSSRDPSAVMIREVSRIDTEAGAVVQALAKGRSGPDGAPPPPPPPESKSRHEAARGRSSSCDSSLSSLDALRRALKRSRSRSRRRRSKPRKDRYKHRSKKRGRREKSKSRSRSRGRKYGRKQDSPKPRPPPKALKDLSNDLDPDFGASFGKQDIEDWLLNLDGGRGAMLRYLEVALKEFNDLSEIKQALLPKERIPEGASIVKMVEPEIFTALGVESLGHRLMLARGIIALNKE